MNIQTLGQVFTPPNIVQMMLALVRNDGSFLEPSCGDGAFYHHLPRNKVGIELDKSIINSSAILNMDFFSYEVKNTFDTIIGNPPYVRFQDIEPVTKKLLSPYMNIFDSRSNLYLFFIYKCILHLEKGGELIFITPRDFLKSTSSIRLNHFIFSQGTITDFIDLGDQKIFKNAQPNCVIWRFERGNFKRNTNFHKEFNCINKEFNCINGQIVFTSQRYCVNFSDLFYVKVGAVSGANEVFAHEECGNMDFVCSQTRKSGKTKKMIYGEYAKTCKHILENKTRLINRKIKKFDEFNWWSWGRDYCKDDSPRIYVNTKTRNKEPFFIHQCRAYDGSVLAVFPKFETKKDTLEDVCDKLNRVNWNELGFVCDGRFLFSQRSLENCILGTEFFKYTQGMNILKF